MKACTFFGHRDCYEEVSSVLTVTIENLILNHNVTHFYVGNQGNFDRIAWRVLKQLKKRHPQIHPSLVLAYFPDGMQKQEFEPTILPEGIENCPKRFTISFRNKWMLKSAEYVIVYVKHTHGGAWQFAELAKKHGKTVINIAEKSNLPL